MKINDVKELSFTFEYDPDTYAYLEKIYIEARLKELAERCKKGKHVWREYGFNTRVDKFFEPTGLQTFVGFIGPEPRKRGCVICGTVEDVKETTPPKEEKEVLFRPHRGDLIKAMAEVRAFKSRAELMDFLNKDLSDYGRKIDEDKFRVEPYCYDDRIGWETYIVYQEGSGVFGFTNGPL